MTLTLCFRQGPFFSFQPALEKRRAFLPPPGANSGFYLQAERLFGDPVQAEMSVGVQSEVAAVRSECVVDAIPFFHLLASHT